MIWPIEEIPDIDILFYRVHKMYIKSGELKPKVFQERGSGDEKGMSTNWNRYSSAQEVKDQAKIPSDNRVIEFDVLKLRAINLNVNHKPLDTNRSHTNVNGLPDDLDDLEIRNNLLDTFTWSITI